MNTKTRPIYILSTRNTLQTKETYSLKVRGWKNLFHANGKQNKAGVAILISDKIDLKIKITRDKEGHYIMIKGLIQEEDITIVSIYAPNTEKAMAPHSSTLAWKIPWMEEPGGLQSMGSLRVGQDSATSLSLFTCLRWRRQKKYRIYFFPSQDRNCLDQRNLKNLFHCNKDK